MPELVNKNPVSGKLPAGVPLKLTRGHPLLALHHCQCFLEKKQTNKKKQQKNTLSAGKEGALWQCTIQARRKALIPGTESHSSSSIPLAPSTDKVICCAVCKKGRHLQHPDLESKSLGKRVYLEDQGNTLRMGTVY